MSDHSQPTQKVDPVCRATKNRSHNWRLVGLDEEAVIATYRCARCGETKLMGGIACKTGV